MEEINKLREIIDQIDLKIVDLIEERAELAKKIGLIKTKKGMPIIQPIREAEIIRNMKKSVSAITSESVGEIWKEIIKACRIMEEGQVRKKIPIESNFGTIIESLDILIESDMIVSGEEIVFDQLDNNNETFTRYLILTTQPHEPTDNDKTSIIFVTLDQPGQLSKVIQLFAEMNVNLTKIESRPRKTEMGKWEYVFFLEFDGNRKDSKINTILGAMENLTTWIKILGSYPKCEVRYG